VGCLTAGAARSVSYRVDCRLTASVGGQLDQYFQLVLHDHEASLEEKCHCSKDKHCQSAGVDALKLVLKDVWTALDLTRLTFKSVLQCSMAGSVCCIVEIEELLLKPSRAVVNRTEETLQVFQPQD
jgi:hypothetical protein